MQAFPSPVNCFEPRVHGFGIGVEVDFLVFKHLDGWRIQLVALLSSKKATSARHHQIDEKPFALACPQRSS